MIERCGKSRVEIDQLLHVRFFEDQKLSCLRRNSGGRSRLGLKKRDLAKQRSIGDCGKNSEFAGIRFSEFETNTADGDHIKFTTQVSLIEDHLLRIVLEL